MGESPEVYSLPNEPSHFIKWKGEVVEGPIENQVHELYETSFSYPAISPTPCMLR